MKPREEDLHAALFLVAQGRVEGYQWLSAMIADALDEIHR